MIITKGKTARAAHRAIGSGNFINGPRSALLAGSDPDDPDTCALCHEKSNVGPKAKPLGYSIKGGRFAWTGDTDLNAAWILGAGDGEARQDAEGILVELCQQEAWSQDVINQAKEEGISMRKIQRVAKKLCSTRREGFGPGSKILWKLKTDATPP